MISPAYIGAINNRPASSIVLPPVSDSLSLWLDAQQLAFSADTEIAAWPDLSLAGTPTTAHNSPQFRVTGVNGKQGVYFTSPNWLEIHLSGVSADTGGTLLMVAATTTTGRSLNAGFAGSSPSPDDSWLTYDGTLYDCNLVGTRSGVTLSGGSTQSNPYVYGALADGTGRIVRFRGSTVISDGQPFNNPVGTQGYQRLGGTNVNVSTDTYNQVIGEVLYYRRRLNPTELATMESYLTTKWAIT